MIRYFTDYRVLYREAAVRESRWRNVEIAFVIDRPKLWGMTDEDFMREADEIFRRFIAETTFTTFPEVYLGGGFERSEESKIETDTFRLEIEYSDYDYDKYFTRAEVKDEEGNVIDDRAVVIKNVSRLLETEEHRAFWDELSRQIRDIVDEEFMWGSKRPSGISVGGRPGGI